MQSEAMAWQFTSRVMIDADLTSALDAAKPSDQSRSEFARCILRRALAARGLSVSPPPQLAGKYDRAKFGLIKDRTLAKKQRRERRRRWGRKHTAKWRAKKEAERAKTIEATLSPTFEVHPDGTVLAMLPTGSVSVGYVAQNGTLMLESSRWPRQKIIEAIVRAVEREASGRLKDARFEKFRAMAVDG